MVGGSVEAEIEKWIERVEAQGIIFYLYTCRRCGKKIKGWTKIETITHAVNHEKKCSRAYGEG